MESQQFYRPCPTHRHGKCLERVSTIQQRVLSRDNLLKIADKYKMFADQSSKLSRTDMLDLMRANTIVKPVELGVQNQIVTVAVTVGFTDRRPDIATNVANELITLFLTKDSQSNQSCNRNDEFLDQEVKKLQSELASIDGKRIRSRERRRETYPNWASSNWSTQPSLQCFCRRIPRPDASKRRLRHLRKKGVSGHRPLPPPWGVITSCSTRLYYKG